MTLRSFLDLTYQVLARMFISSAYFNSLFLGFFGFAIVVTIPCILRCFLWGR